MGKITAEKLVLRPGNSQNSIGAATVCPSSTRARLAIWTWYVGCCHSVRAASQMDVYIYVYKLKPKG
jgi:hypothetical protein